MSRAKWNVLMADVALARADNERALGLLQEASRQDSDVSAEDAAYQRHCEALERLDGVIAEALALEAPDADALKWKLATIRAYCVDGDPPSFVESALPAVLAEVIAFLDRAEVKAGR